MTASATSSIIVPFTDLAQIAALDGYKMDHIPLFSDDYLRSRWEPDFTAFRESGEDSRLLDRLRKWHDRDRSRTETQLEAQFDHIFFRETWGYWGTGEHGREPGYCLNPQYAVAGAGQAGGTGAADLALGWWDREGVPTVPQVLCEFKDIRSGLDAPQKRKGNDRSPVKQCFDYLKYAFDATDIHSTLTPNWGLVTDMNEFRLYLRRVGDSQYQRFFIKPPAGVGIALIDEGAGPTLQRFLLGKSKQTTISLAAPAKCPLTPIEYPPPPPRKSIDPPRIPACSPSLHGAVPFPPVRTHTPPSAALPRLRPAPVPL